VCSSAIAIQLRVVVVLRAEAKLQDSGLVARGRLLQGSHLILTAGSQGQLSAEGAPLAAVFAREAASNFQRPMTSHVSLCTSRMQSVCLQPSREGG